MPPPPSRRQPTGWRLPGCHSSRSPAVPETILAQPLHQPRIALTEDALSLRIIKQAARIEGRGGSATLLGEGTGKPIAATTTSNKVRFIMTAMLLHPAGGQA